MSALNRLAGERNAPELPVPISAIRSHATRFGLSEVFVSMVQEYDLCLMSEQSKALSNRRKHGSPK